MTIGSWWSSIGGLKRNIGEVRKVDCIENGPLNAYHYWTITKDEKVKNDLMEYMKNATKEDPITGVITIKNHVDPKVLEKTPEISHDQLTFTAMASKEWGLDYHDLIWRELKWFKYDDRFQHPRDVIFYGILNDSFIARLCSPLLMLIMVFTFLRKWATREKLLHNSPTLKIYEKRVFIKNSEARLWRLRVRFLGIFFKYVFTKLEAWRFPESIDVNYFEHNTEHPVVAQL